MDSENNAWMDYVVTKIKAFVCENVAEMKLMLKLGKIKIINI